MQKPRSNIESNVKLLNKYQNALEALVQMNVDPVLVNILSNAFDGFRDIDPKESPRVDYMQNMTDELQNWILDNGKSTEIDNLLIQINFNARKYFLLLIKRISELLSNEDSMVGKLELLAFEYKKVNQIPVEANLYYSTKYLQLKEIIGSWIEEEVSYLEKKRKLNNSITKQESLSNNMFKIPMDMSVAQFACLIRAFIERKVVLNNNLTELAGFLSTIIVTKRSENISEGSFRRKYYNIEDGTKKSVVEILNKTIDWLMKN